ncbi:MAG: HEAT repeat domain-containing protein [Planctomycetota bacterium]
MAEAALAEAPRGAGGEGEGRQAALGLLAGGLLLEAAWVALAAVGELALASGAHLLASGLLTAAIVRRTPAEQGQAPALLGGLATLLLPPLGALAALVAWRSAAPTATREGLLEDLFEELHQGPSRPERQEAPDHGAALLDAIDLEPYADALRYGDLSLRRGAIERLREQGGPDRIKVLRRALRDRDEEVRALALAALAHIDQQLNRAVVAATRAVREDPQSIPAHAELGDRLAEFCYLDVADAAQRGHYHALAFRCYARAIELCLDPARDAELVTALGKMLLGLGHTQAAREAFSLAVHAAPGDARPLLWRAEASFALGELDEVEQDCRRALALEPGRVVRDAATFWAPEAAPKAPPPSSRHFRRSTTRFAADEDISPEQVQQVLAEIGELPGEASLDEADLGEALEALVRDLGAEDAARRARAFDALATYTSDEAVAAVAERCRGMSAAVRRLWARYLGRVGSLAAMRDLVGLLDDPDAEVRQEARVALGGLRELNPERAEVLLRSLDDRSPRVRAFAAEALGLARLERAVLPLIDRLRDPDTEVRLAVVEALRRANDPRAGRPLARLLSDPQEAVRYRVAHALGALGGKTPRALQRVALEDPSPRVRLVAVWSAATLGGRAAMHVLTEALARDPDPRVRVEACRRLGKLGLRRGVPALVRANAEDEDHGVRLAASFALDLVPEAEALGPLTAALDEAEPQLRFTAVTKLGDLPPSPRIAAVLTDVLASDADPIVRAGAAGSLGRLGSREVVPALERALADPDEAVAYAATVAFMVLLVPDGLDALERHLATDPPLASLQRQALLRFVRNMAQGRRLPPRVLRLATSGLTAEDANVRYLSAEVLGVAALPETLDGLLAAAAREPFADPRRAMERAAGAVVAGDPTPLLERIARLEDDALAEDAQTLAQSRAALRALATVRPSPTAVVVSFLRLLALRRRLRAAGLLPAEREAYLAFFAHDPAALLHCVSWSQDPLVLVPALRAIDALAARGVRGFGDTSSLQALVDHPDRLVQAEALGALGALGDAGLFRTLVYLALEDPQEQQGPAAAARRAVRELVEGARA